MEYIGQDSPWSQHKRQQVLGSGEFVEVLRPYIQDADKRNEVPRAQRWLDRPALPALFENKAELVKANRDDKIRQAKLIYAYGLAEIGRFLELHYATISRNVQGER